MRIANVMKTVSAKAVTVQTVFVTVHAAAVNNNILKMLLSDDDIK